LNVKINLVEDIIKACIVLHNFVHERDDYNFDHTLYVEGVHEIPEGAVKVVVNMRVMFMNFLQAIFRAVLEKFHGSAVKYKYTSRTQLFIDLQRTFEYKIS